MGGTTKAMHQAAISMAVAEAVGGAALYFTVIVAAMYKVAVAAGYFV